MLMKGIWARNRNPELYISPERSGKQFQSAAQKQTWRAQSCARTSAPTLGSHLLFFLMNLSSFRFMRYTTGLEVIRGLLFSQSVSFTFQSPNLQDAGVCPRLSRP